MVDPTDLIGVLVGSVVAPAGHGKTELIVRTASLGKRTLILTHTHAGVHAIRTRLKRLGADPRCSVVDTIASWASRYASAFPGRGKPIGRMPAGSEWGRVYQGGVDVLDVSGVRSVVRASYDRVLVDEYQDCDLTQHSLVCALSRILPTVVFGDAMQGIFDFRENPSVSWQRDVFPMFPLVGTLEEPMRWKSTNPDLGAWVAKVRGQLERGEVIDLTDVHVQCRDDIDLSPLFDDFDSHGNSVAAIHCRRDTCDRIARFSMGSYQAIEDVAAKSLQGFAAKWENEDGARRVELLKELLKSLLTLKKLSDDEQDSDEDKLAWEAMQTGFQALSRSGQEADAICVIESLRKHSRTRVFRSELLRDTVRALVGVSEGRYKTLTTGAAIVRQRISASGRWMPRRTVSTPLLLKGLEFEHVVVPDATHFYREGDAAAKLFYVAISRARSKLVLASSSPKVQFPVPKL